MSAFDIAAVLVAIAAVSGYINHRLLHLPATSGTLFVSLISSLLVIGLGRLAPGIHLEADIQGFLEQIDIAPTGPVAVMGLLKELQAPASLEAQIAGVASAGGTRHVVR